MLKLLCVVSLIAITFASLESNEWDQLENILQNLDEIDKKTFTDDDDDVNDNSDEVTIYKSEGPVIRNPCEQHVCGWGKECVIVDGGRGAKCECATRCAEVASPDPYDKVCSSHNETFPSLCHLYRERCMCKRGMAGCEDKAHAKTHLEYLGQCKNLEICTDELMAQFPERMADWLFQVMKDLKSRQSLHGDKWQNMLTEAQEDDTLKHVYPVIWKFCDLDKKPHDKAVTHHELIPITAPVIPMESCIKPFLERCDADNDGVMTLMEWGQCLGLSLEEIVEKC